MLVSISGVGGTGKTSTAEVLARRLKWKLVKLNDLAKKTNAYIGYDAKRKSKIVSIGKLRKELKKIYPRKYENLIIEGLYAHEFPADITIVLRCKPSMLEMRLKRKYTWPTKITENVEAEMIGLITAEALGYHKASKVYEIDTTELSASRTAKIIESIIVAAGKGRPIEKYAPGKIDWLG
jgi:adenylate kinase